MAGQSWPELRARQHENLGRLICRAREGSPFWADRLVGVQIGAEIDLEQLPVLSKRALREAGRRAVCRDVGPRELLAEQTSGSTGTPMTYYTSVTAVRRYCAFYRSFRAWHGYEPGQRRARLGGRLILPARQRRPPFWLYDPAQDTIYLSVYHMSEETMPQYTQAIVDYRPASSPVTPPASSSLPIGVCGTVNAGSAHGG